MKSATAQALLLALGLANFTGAAPAALAQDYKNPPAVDWSGVYQPFEAKESFLKSLSVSQTGKELKLDGVMVMKKDKETQSLTLAGTPTVARELDAKGNFENLFILCKGTTNEPFLLIKADNFTPEGKAHPGQYFFYNCYFTSGKPAVYLSGRLTKAAK